MHPRLPLVATALSAVALLGACGSDDEPTPTTPGAGPATPAAGGGSAACIDSWNKASKDLRAQASLTHRGDGPDVQVGTYTGTRFDVTGETYDTSGSSYPLEVVVAPGDCVAVDLTSGEKETNWVMVESKTGEKPGWAFVPEDGSHELAKVPQPLGEPVKATIAGFGVDAKLTPQQ